ncbi:hypothetical protein MTR_8g086320 [Medicago truncatula]|uniref:Uncharacterized protein n=1 Tax=Medicago truncatula TaxID=3880 RepID=G7LJD8_MEDTR|nr:hypothetical protein MTR_8g086320 [Medicago truncatula]
MLPPSRGRRTICEISKTPIITFSLFFRPLQATIGKTKFIIFFLLKSSTKLVNLFCDLSSLVYDHRTGVRDHCTGKVIHNYLLLFSSSWSHLFN